MASESGHNEHEDVFEHIRDAEYFHVPKALTSEEAHGHLTLPYIEWLPSPGKILLSIQGKLPEGESIMGFQITKFMVLGLVAALFVFLVFWLLAKRAKGGAPVKGRWWNFWEALALYMREEVARPILAVEHEHHPGHDDDAVVDQVTGNVAHTDAGAHMHEYQDPVNQFTPYIWSCFFFILICNLLGMIPWLGSPTGNIWMTGALAITTFGVVLAAGMKEQGVTGFWKGLVPDLDLPPALGLFLVPMIWVIEFFGLLIKHGVLAVRLFANMMGGHTVLFVLLTFIATTGGLFTGLGALVTPASVLGQVGVMLLELLVAFIQAYVFAFLTTIFLSMSLHPH